MRILKEFFSALSFFTVLPLPGKYFPPSLSFFPWVGLVIGGALYISHLLFSPFPPAIEALLLLWVSVWFTGGLHWEGLTDTFDAILSRKDKESSLKIMKDPSTGVMGVIALITFLSLKFLGFYTLITVSPLSLLSVPLLSRLGMILIVYTNTPARKEGLGYLFWKAKREVIYPLLSLIPLFLILKFKIFPVLAFTILFYYLIGKYFQKKWGGFTGDTLGMSIESGEIFLLFLLARIGKGW